MNLQAAIICSVIIHLGFLAARPPSGMLPPRESLRPIEITFLPAGLAPAGEIINPSAVSSPRRSSSGSDRAVSPKPVRPVVKPVSSKAAKTQRQVSSARSQQTGASSATPQVASDPLPATGKTPPVIGGVALPQAEFAALEHKELIREHLRAKLRYPAFWVEGSVRIRVVLTPAGQLLKAEVLEASSPRLRSAALNAMRQAAPYPTFPKGVKARQADYEFLVQYRPN